MKKQTVIIAAIVFVMLMSGVYAYMFFVVFPSPENCNTCHFITPFYNKWKASTHKDVPCLKCHDYSIRKALAGQFMFLAGAYNPRPLTNVPDKNCLQSGCHEKRLIESKTVFSKRGIIFDHSMHFNEMKRGIKLHCRSCHSDIVQGEHLKVSMNVCYLCHFKGMPHDTAFTGCPSCHTSPKELITVKGKSFSHKDYAKAGYKCNRCHLEVTRGDGVTHKDKCYFCHVEQAEKYSDVKFVHEWHVGQKQVDCLWCHSKIEHGKIKISDDLPEI